MKTTGTASTRTNDDKQATGRQADTAGTGGRKGPLLEKLFLDMLKDMYWAEGHLVEKLQVMRKAATTDELQEAFEDHQYLTQKHKSRLERVFKMLGEEPEGKKCEAMEGLTKEAESIIKETPEGTMTRDAGLIIAAQKVEHYEIASYGSLVQIARTLGHDDAADILERTLWEEEDTDELLTDIAESDINPMADEEESEETEDSMPAGATEAAAGKKNEK